MDLWSSNLYVDQLFYFYLMWDIVLHLDSQQSHSQMWVPSTLVYFSLSENISNHKYSFQLIINSDDTANCLLKGEFIRERTTLMKP